MARPLSPHDVVLVVRALGMSVHIAETLRTASGVMDGAGDGLPQDVEHLGIAKQNHELFEGLVGLRVRHLWALERAAELEDIRRDQGSEVVDSALERHGISAADRAAELAEVPLAVRLDQHRRWTLYLRG